MGQLTFSSYIPSPLIIAIKILLLFLSIITRSTRFTTYSSMEYVKNKIFAKKKHF